MTGLVRGLENNLSQYLSLTRLPKSHKDYVDSSSTDHLFLLRELDSELIEVRNKLYELENHKFSSQDENSEVYYGLISLGFSLEELLSLSRREFYSLYYRVANIQERKYEEEMRILSR